MSSPWWPPTDGKGYWVLEKGLSGLGSIQAFGDAVNFGDEAAIAHATGHVGTPVAMAATSDDGGYWIVDSDGGVFSFGDAAFEGSMGGRTLAAPVVGIAAVPGGRATGGALWWCGFGFRGRHGSPDGGGHPPPEAGLLAGRLGPGSRPRWCASGPWGATSTAPSSPSPVPAPVT